MKALQRFERSVKHGPDKKRAARLKKPGSGMKMKKLFRL